MLASPVVGVNPRPKLRQLRRVVTRRVPPSPLNYLKIRQDATLNGAGCRAGNGPGLGSRGAGKGVSDGDRTRDLQGHNLAL